MRKFCLFQSNQETRVSISGISAASSAAYIQQPQNTIQSSATATAAPAQATVPAPTGAAPQSGPTQQAGPVQPSYHHHRHGGGDGGAQASDISSTGTNAAEGTNILNTLA